MTTIIGFVFALGLTALAPQDVPAPAPQEQPAVPSLQETPVEEIEVVGQPLRRLVDTFVDAAVAPPVGRGPARWPRKVCVGVVNLQREAAQALVDRVSEVALELELEIGEPGCSPNILIVATDDGAGLASALVAERPLAFRPKFAGASRSERALERFQTSDAAVRWWHVSLPVVRDTGEPAVRLPGELPPMIPGGSRLRTEVQNDLLRAYVIVDVDGPAALSLPQLADYVAMVAFAQINPDADLSAYPTVLNLFANPAVVQGMTDWDMAYLRSLYAAELNQRNPGAQNGAAGNIMFRDRLRAQEQATE